MDIVLSDELEEFLSIDENIQNFFTDITNMCEKYLFSLKDSFVWVCEENHAECFNFRGDQYAVFRDAFVNVPDFEIAFVYSYNKGKEFYYACLNCELAE